MGTALKGRPRRDFPVPQSIVFARIDRQTGLLASQHSKETVFQSFIEGSEPTESAAEVRSDTRALQDLREDAFGGDANLKMRLDSF
jgi:membrane carboxypeptidase/penicillin-binding protein